VSLSNADRLRAQLRDAIQTLSDARRSDVWEIVDELCGHQRLRAGLSCHDCSRSYGDKYGFCDLVVSNEAWVKIGPQGDEGGLLCPACMVRRAVIAGVECEATFMSGPFVQAGKP